MSQRAAIEVISFLKNSPFLKDFFRVTLVFEEISRFFPFFLSSSPYDADGMPLFRFPIYLKIILHMNFQSFYFFFHDIVTGLGPPEECRILALAMLLKGCRGHLMQHLNNPPALLTDSLFLNFTNSNIFYSIL